MKTLICTLLLSTLLLTAPAYAADHGDSTIEPFKLSAKDRVDIARIQDYLNNLKNLSSSFMQINDQGSMMSGKLAIQRPGKMRVDYDPPSGDYIIADGSTVHIWDNELKAQTNVDEGSSLAEFILRDPVRLSGDVTITHFQRFPAKLEVTLVQTNDPANGSLTLIFEDRPLMLRQWRVLDAQGHTTGVNLQNMREDVSFSSTLFDFVPPTFGKGGKAQ